LSKTATLNTEVLRWREEVTESEERCEATSVAKKTRPPERERERESSHVTLRLDYNWHVNTLRRLS